MMGFPLGPGGSFPAFLLAKAPRKTKKRVVKTAKTANCSVETISQYQKVRPNQGGT